MRCQSQANAIQVSLLNHSDILTLLCTSETAFIKHPVQPKSQTSVINTSPSIVFQKKKKKKEIHSRRDEFVCYSIKQKEREIKQTKNAHARIEIDTISCLQSCKEEEEEEGEEDEWNKILQTPLHTITVVVVVVVVANTINQRQQK